LHSSRFQLKQVMFFFVGFVFFLLLVACFPKMKAGPPG